MKKLFSSAVSAAAAIACLLSNSALPCFAEATDTETGVFTGECEELLFEEAEETELSLPNTPQILSNYSSSAYNYGDYLDDNNKAVYDALSEWVTPTLDEMVVELPETISLTLSGLPNTDAYTEEDAAAFSEAVFGACKPGVDSLLFDLPEIFWLDPAGLTLGVADATYKYSNRTQKYTFEITALKFMPALEAEIETLDEAMEYKEKLEAAVEEFASIDGTMYEKIKTIHDNIAEFTYYDESAGLMSSAIGSLVEPGVVCEGYSEGFKLICDYLDIPCVLVFGNYDASSNVAHMWNYIKMDDDKWYAIDLTWDDLDGDGGEVKYAYFLKGSTSFFTNHTEEPDYLGTIFTYPEIASDNYTPIQSEVTTTTTVTTTTIAETTTTAKKTTTTEAETTTTKAETTTTEAETTTGADTTTVKATTTTTSEEVTTTKKTTTTAALTTTTEAETTTSKKVTTTTVSEPITTELVTTTAETETTTQAPTEPETETTTAPEYDKADFNRDGYVNAADLVICAKAVHGDTTDYPCDYNEDGQLDVYDLVLMRKRVLLDI